MAAIAMVKDGIKNVQVLAKADLGMSYAWWQTLPETGSTILIKDDIRNVVTAFDLGRKMVSEIKQNLFWTYAYKYRIDLKGFRGWTKWYRDFVNTEIALVSFPRT